MKREKIVSLLINLYQDVFLKERFFLFFFYIFQDVLSPIDEDEAESQTVLIGDKNVKVKNDSSLSFYT